MNSQELKALETRKNKLAVECKLATQEANESKRKLQSLQVRLKEIEAHIKTLKANDGVIVSEHAMLRYCERVLGVNLQEIAAKILPDVVRAQIATLGNGKFPVPDQEFSIRVKDGTVVTLLTGDER